MADAGQYRDWAAQQVSIRTRNALLDEADRLERRDEVRSGGAGATIKISVALKGTHNDR